MTFYTLFDTFLHSATYLRNKFAPTISVQISWYIKKCTYQRRKYFKIKPALESRVRFLWFFLISALQYLIRNYIRGSRRSYAIMKLDFWKSRERVNRNFSNCGVELKYIYAYRDINVSSATQASAWWVYRKNSLAREHYVEVHVNLRDGVGSVGVQSYA